MKHQYAHTIPEPHRCSLLHRRVYTSPSKTWPVSRERRGRVTNVAGAICIGQVVALYMTARRRGGGREREFARKERKVGVPHSLPSLVSSRLVSCRLVVGCARRVVGGFMHFTYFAYETHADAKPATIRAAAGIIPRTESDISSNNNNNNNHARLSDGDCLLSTRPEVVWRTEGMPLPAVTRARDAGPATITVSPKLRTHDDINGVPAHFASISELLDSGSTDRASGRRRRRRRGG